MPKYQANVLAALRKVTAKKEPARPAGMIQRFLDKNIVAALKVVVGSPGTPKGSFQRKYLEEHLDDAIGTYLLRDDQDDTYDDDVVDEEDQPIRFKPEEGDELELQGYVEVDNYDEWGIGGVVDDYVQPRGWGKDMDREEFIEEISKDGIPGKHDQKYFAELFDKYEKNRLAPAIAINESVVDGVGRSIWAHALDIPLLVASFFIIKKKMNTAK